MAAHAIECTLEEAKRSFCTFYKLPFGTKVSIEYTKRDKRALRGNKVVRRRSWKKVSGDASRADLREMFMEAVDLDYKGMKVVIDVQGTSGKTKLKNLIGPLKSDEDLLEVFRIFQRISGPITCMYAETNAVDPEHVVVATLQALENEYGSEWVEDCWINRHAFRPTAKIIRRFERDP